MIHFHNTEHRYNTDILKKYNIHTYIIRTRYPGINLVFWPEKLQPLKTKTNNAVKAPLPEPVLYRKVQGGYLRYAIHIIYTVQYLCTL